MNSRIKWMPVVLALMVWHCVVQAQVTAIPEKKAIAPGEPLPVQISISSKTPTRPLLTDTLGKFEVLKRDSPLIRQASGEVLFTQSIIITSFDSGRFVLPAIHAEDGTVAASQPDTIQVSRLPSDSLKGYTDIRHYFTEEEKDINSLVTAVLMAAAVVSGAVLFFLLRRRKQDRLPDEASITSKQAWQKEWKNLQQQWKAGQLSHEQAAAYIMILSRTLFALQGTPTASKTGAELVRAAQQQWDAAHWQPFKTVISHCYSILFAQQQPGKQPVAEQIDALGAIGDAIIPSNTSEPRT